MNVSLSPILTVSTSFCLASRILILGAGASGAEVMLIMSGSLMGIMPKVMFLLLVSYVHLTWRQRNMICEFSFKSYERLYLVDFVSLCHHDAVPLNHDSVGVDSTLEIFQH